MHLSRREIWNVDTVFLYENHSEISCLSIVKCLGHEKL